MATVEKAATGHPIRLQLSVKLPTTIPALLLLSQINLVICALPIASAGADTGINLAEYYGGEVTAEVITDLDIDGDGDYEVIEIHHGANFLLIRTLFGEQWKQIPFRKELSIVSVACANLFPNRDNEIVVTCKGRTSYLFYIIADVLRSHKIIDIIEFENGDGIKDPENWDGYYYFVGSYDINDDDSPDMIFAISTGLHVYPREVFAYDLQAKERLWTYKSANAIKAEHMTDLDGDDVPEIIVAGDAPHNGAVKGTQTDDRCRLMILDISGEELWIREFGKGSNACNVEPTPSEDRNRTKLAVSVTYPHRQEGMADGKVIDKKGKTDLYILDALTGNAVNSIAIDGVANTMISYKFEKSPSGEIAVSFEDGTIRVFDDKLGPVRKRNFGADIRVHSVYDLNSDGYPEYCISSTRGKALILDQSLNDIAFHFDTRFIGAFTSFALAKSNGEKPFKLFLTGSLISGKVVTKRFLIPDIAPFGGYEYLLWFLGRHGKSIGPFVIIALLIVWIVLLKRRQGKQRSFYRSIVGNDSLGVIHVSKGIFVTANRKAEIYLDFSSERLRGRVFSLLIDSPGLEELKTNLTDLAAAPEDQFFNVGTNIKGKSEELEVRVIMMKTKRDQPVEYLLLLARPEMSKKEWLTLAKGIAHDTKNPSGLASTQLSSLSAELRSDANLSRDDIISKIEKANSNIKRSLDRVNMFAGIVKELKITPAKTSINNYLKDYAVIRKLSVPRGMSLKFEASLSMPDILLDPKYFELALDNLLHNSIDAISPKGTGSITISSGVDTVPFKTDYGEKLTKSVSISFSDTGTGIPEENLLSIFNLDFSTKKGKGLGMGLYQVKRIIEEHGGKIQVDSYEGEGTTFTIYLPVEE